MKYLFPLTILLTLLACQPDAGVPCQEDAECMRGQQCSAQGYCEDAVSCSEDGECMRNQHCNAQGYCQDGTAEDSDAGLFDGSAQSDAAVLSDVSVLSDVTAQDSQVLSDAAAHDSGTIQDANLQDHAGLDAGSDDVISPSDASQTSPDSATNSDANSGQADAGTTQNDAGSSHDSASSDSGTPEICDGLDNDGQGGVDDGLTAPDICLNQGVCTGLVAHCAGVNGWVCDYASIDHYEAEEQSCDGLDNDCDGNRDEDLTAPDICLNKGVCTGLVVAHCAGANGWACDYASVENYEAEEQSCDGLDNDCDGETDEGFSLTLANGDVVEHTGMACGAGACSGGMTVCSTDMAGIICSTADQASSEICDGQDNDCDGVADDGLVAPDMCNQKGVCSGMSAQCHGANSWQCDYVDVENYEATEISRDLLDNNCDGFVDELSDDEGEALQADRQYHAATINPAAEFDYWPIQLAAGDYNLRVTAYPANPVDLRVGLFAASGQQMGDFVDVSGPGSYEIMNLTIQDASQTYFVGISSKGNSAGAYQVALYPGLYDASSIGGGDAPSAYTSIPDNLVVAGALWNGADPFGNNIDGDELVTLTTDGSATFAQVSNFRMAGMLIRDVDISPDRTRIAFASNWNAGRYDAYVQDMTTQRVRRLSPDQIACPSGMATSGFGHPSFVDDDKLVFIGECMCMDSNQCTWGSELDLLFEADLTSDSAASWKSIASNGCLQPVLIPRAKFGGSEVGISSNGCAINIAGETTTGGKITRYKLSDATTLGDLPAIISGQTSNTQHKLAGWDFSPDGTHYAVVTDEGLYEFNSSTGAITHGPVDQGTRPNSADYWNRETIAYAPGASSLVYTYWNTGDAVNVYKLDLVSGTWTSLAVDIVVRRGVAW